MCGCCRLSTASFRSRVLPRPMIAKFTLFILTRAISQAVVKAIHALRAVENRSAEQQNPYFVCPTECPLMEWSGGAARQRLKLARGAKDKEHAMSQNPDSAVAVIGIDIGKNSFHVVM